jgi:Membrane bound FAD containing D-sorbitol dehydrogenase
MPDRRMFLVRSVATLAAGSFLAVEGCAPQRAAAIVGPPTGAQMSDFVALSSALLGIEAAKLAPDPDPGNMKTEVFAAAQGQDAQALGTLLGILDANRAKSPPEIAEAMLERSGPEMAFFAKAIMLGWLLGNWYDPAALAQVVTKNLPGPIASRVISANAYRESWAWKIAQTKPMGTSDQAFGYWSKPPPPLSDFIGTP